MEREREREREPQAGFTFSTEPDTGLNPMTVRSRPEPTSRIGCSTDWATQVPLPFIFNLPGINFCIRCEVGIPFNFSYAVNWHSQHFLLSSPWYPPMVHSAIYAWSASRLFFSFLGVLSFVGPGLHYHNDCSFLITPVVGKGRHPPHLMTSCTYNFYLAIFSLTDPSSRSKRRRRRRKKKSKRRTIADFHMPTVVLRI